MSLELAELIGAEASALRKMAEGPVEGAYDKVAAARAALYRNLARRDPAIALLWPFLEAAVERTAAAGATITDRKPTLLASGSEPVLAQTAADETVWVIDDVFASLTSDGQRAVRLAALFNERFIPRAHLWQLGAVGGWEAARMASAIDEAVQHSLLVEEDETLRMHELVAAYLRTHDGPPIPVAVLRRHRAAFLEAAHACAACPTDAALRQRLAGYPARIEVWDQIGGPTGADDLHQVGSALAAAGRFEEAVSWLERAVAERCSDDDEGGADHPRLVASLYQLASCLWSLALFGEARPWFQRAALASEHGDGQGRVDYESLGRCLHQAGACSSSLGQFDEARSWFHRAVLAKEQGDLQGRVDHESLGKSLNQVGYCLWHLGRLDEVPAWFERAVDAKEQGDVEGRVDHESLGRSLSQVGCYLSALGQFDEARP